MGTVEIPQIVLLVPVIFLFVVGILIILRGLMNKKTHCCKNQKKEKKSTEDIGCN